MYVFVVINKFSILGWTAPLRENAQTEKNFFERVLISSQREPNLIESDQGKEFCNNTFQNFLKRSNIKISSINIPLNAVFAERINRTIGDQLRRLVLNEMMLIGILSYPQ